MITQNDVQAMNNLFIWHRQAKYIRSRILECINDLAVLPDRENISLEGPSGVGKTLLLREIMKEMERYETPSGTVIPALISEVPAAAMRRGFLVKTMLDLNGFTNTKGTIPELTENLVLLLRDTQTKLVVLDEFHHLFQSQKRRTLEDVSELIKSLVRRVDCVFVTIGIEHRVNKIFEANEQLRRHFTPIKLEPFALDPRKPETISEFSGLIEYIREHAGFEIAPEIDPNEFLFRIHYATKGHLTYMMPMLRKSTSLAHQSGLECLPARLLETVFVKHFQAKTQLVENPFAISSKKLQKLYLKDLPFFQPCIWRVFKRMSPNTSFLEPRPFLKRTELLDGESTDGLVHRCAELNHFKTLQSLLYSIGYRTSAKPSILNLNDQISLNTLAALTSLEPADLYDASIQRYGGFHGFGLSSRERLNIKGIGEKFTLNVRHRNKYIRKATNRAFCPKCLEESLHDRIAWSYKLNTICPKHKCLLCIGCPNCKAGIDLNSIMCGKCGVCEFDLRKSKPVSLVEDSRGLETASWICGLIDGTARVGDKLSCPVLKDCSREEIVSLILGLTHVKGFLFGPEMRHRPTFLYDAKITNMTWSKLQNPFVYVLFVTVVNYLNEGWSTGFVKLLSDLRKASWEEQRIYPIKKSLGTLYTSWIDGEWKCPEFSFVQEVFDYYLANCTLDRAKKHLITQKRDPNCKYEPEKFMDARDASKYLGLSHSGARFFIQTDILKPYCQWGFYHHEPSILIDKKSIEDLKKILDIALTPKLIANKLGLNVRTVRSLADQGVFELLRGPSIDDQPLRIISRESFETFKEKLFDQTKEIYGERKYRLPSLFQVCSELSPYGVGLIFLITKALNKELTLLATRKSVDLIKKFADDSEQSFLWWFFLSHQAKQSLVDEIKNSAKTVSFQHTLKLLGIKRKHILNQWIAQRLITPLKDGELTKPRFAKKAIQQFQENYVSSQQAGEIIGVNKIVIQKWTRNGRLQPVSGPSVDGLHRYLYRRDHIEIFRPENRLTAPALGRILGLSRSQVVIKIQNGSIFPKPISGPGYDRMSHYLFLKEQLSNLQLGDYLIRNQTSAPANQIEVQK